MKPRTRFSTFPGFSDLSSADKRRFHAWHAYHAGNGRTVTVADFHARRGYSGEGWNNGRPTVHGAPPGTPRIEADAHRVYCNRYGEVPFAEWLAKYRPRKTAAIISRAERIAAKINAKALAQRGAGE